MSLWRKFERPLSDLLPNDHRHRNAVTDENGNGTGKYWAWERDYNSVYLWDRHTPLVVPKNRRQRPYLLRGVVDYPAGRTGPDPTGAEQASIPRLTSWLELRRAEKYRANLHRKMAGLVRTMRNNPDHLRYFTTYFGSELGLRGPRSEEVLAAVQPTESPAPRAAIEFLDAGSRHKRRVFLDEQ